MGIAMNGVIADNVRAEQSATNPTENHVTVRVEMHYDGAGEEVRATGDILLSMHFGRYPVPTAVKSISTTLVDAIAKLPRDQFDRYLELIKQAAIAAAEGGGSLPPATARDLDLSE